MAVKMVSTHSRLKAAGQLEYPVACISGGFNTQPPEGGWVLQYRFQRQKAKVSTHSRLKAAGLDSKTARVKN